MYCFPAAQLAKCILLRGIFHLLQKHQCTAATRPQGYRTPKRSGSTRVTVSVFGEQHSRGGSVTSSVEAAQFGAEL